MAAPTVSVHSTQRLGEVTVDRVVLEVEPQILVPLLLLLPKGDGPRPVVVAISQHGKQEFLRQRPEAITELLASGVAVCLPDLRGTGETRPGDGRGRTSAATSISSTELMLGQTLVGSRLRDLRSVLQYLRGRSEVDPARIALWGDSFAPANPDGRDLAVPLDAEKLPDQAEPLGGLLALLGALFDDQVQAVYVHGGLVGYQSVLQSPFVYIPHDVVVPGALMAGDLCDVAAALAPRPLRLEGLVDGLNRRVPAAAVRKVYEPARDAYRLAAVPDGIHIGEGEGKPAPAAWLRAQLHSK
jgi:hypothetical protein